MRVLHPARRAVLIAALAAAPAIPPHDRALATQPSLTQALPDDGWLVLENVDLNDISRVERQYPVDFAAYLARLLIAWEPVTRRWWENRQAEAAAFAPASDIRIDTPFAELGVERQQYYCRTKFQSLTASVLVGLGKFRGADGLNHLVSNLRARYGRSMQQKRQLAVLLSLLGDLQPVDEIRALVGEADDAQVKELQIDSPIRGFSAQPPRLLAAAPPTKYGRQANLRAILERSGRWLSTRVVDGGHGYKDGEDPVVSLSIEPTLDKGRPAAFKATIINGSVVAVQIVDAGEGYSNREDEVELFIAPPAASRNDPDANPARATVLPEYQLVGGEVLDGGAGYSADEPPIVDVISDSVMDLPKIKIATVVSDRMGALSPVELAALEERYARNPIGLDVPSSGPPTLLPNSVVPVRASSSSSSASIYSLPIRLAPGTFGVPSETPVEYQTPLTLDAAAKIFLCGAACSSTAHTALVPIDVVKTRMQAEPGVYSNALDCTRRVLADEGMESFLQGGFATFLGYALAGSLSFGGVEVFGRAIRSAAGPGNALLFSTPYLILASVVATTLCATAICPFESIRILSVRTGESSQEVARRIFKEKQALQLFTGFPSLLLKEIPFVVAKFVVFESVSVALLSAFPELRLSGAASIFSGAFSGVVAALLSQPADTVFTIANDGAGMSLTNAFDQIKKKPSLILEGLGARLVFGALLVSLQFFLYTSLRRLLDVSASDLTLVWDALSVLGSDPAR